MEWLRIGEVARRTGLTARTLRHYDELGLLVPSARSGADYRLYAPEDLHRLLEIQHLKSLGLSLEEIAAALHDPDFDAADTLERHIGALEDRLAAGAELLERLRRLRDSAGAGWEDVLEVIALTERLRHPDAWVRFRAALDAPTLVSQEELIDLLRHDPSPAVREGATWALAQHGPDAVDAVLDHIDDADPVVRHQMAHALGKLADPRGASALAGLLEDPETEVATTAAFALGQIGGPVAVTALTGALGRGGTLRRSVVVDAVGRLGPAATASLVAALAHTDPAVRADAAEALAHLDDPEAVEALVHAADDDDVEVAVIALMSLAALGTPRARSAIADRADRPGRPGAVARRLQQVPGA